MTDWSDLLTAGDLAEMGFEGFGSVKPEEKGMPSFFEPMIQFHFHGVAEEYRADAIRLMLTRSKGFRLDDVKEISFFGAGQDNEGQQPDSECHFLIITFWKEKRSPETIWLKYPKWVAQAA